LAKSYFPLPDLIEFKHRNHKFDQALLFNVLALAAADKHLLDEMFLNSKLGTPELSFVTISNFSIDQR
jgi:hypothetical protein